MAKNIWEEGLFSPKKSKNSSEEQGRRTLWNALNVLRSNNKKEKSKQ